jgi:cell division transport system ATP-binding protein
LFPQYLSSGEQQRVGIARAVVTRPKILLADEPTGNLDPELSRDIMQLFEQFNEVGTTVIVASHDRDLIESMGMRIIELGNGAIVRDWVGGGNDGP